MKPLLKYLLAAACLCGVVACEEEKERPQDAPPSRSATIFFVVTDADTGEDLLDPEVENCLLEDVRITYDGNVYRYDMERGVGIYTATLERFIMRWGHYTKRRPDDPYCLSIGKFDCDPDGLEASFSVDWGDGGETTEVQFRFTENYYETPYLEANGIPAVTAALDENYNPILGGDVPPVGYFNDCWFIVLKR